MAVIDQDFFAPAAHSRHNWKFKRRGVDQSLWTVIENLVQEVAGRFEAIVIVPMEEECVLSLSRAPSLTKTHWLVASEGAVQIANSKKMTGDVALSIGVRIPQSLELPLLSLDVPVEGSLDALADSCREFIVQNKIDDWVLKPSVSKGSVGIQYGSGSVSTSLLKDYFQRLSEIATLDRTAVCLLQERVPSQGDAIGVSLLFDAKGELVAISSHRRIHEYPLTGGPSTLRESIAAPHEERESIRLLKALEWRGVAMVEWKRNPKTGESILLEVNGRFWGSLELAVRAGVDFPKLYVEKCLEGASHSERASQPVFRNRVGVKCRWLLPGDILRYLGDPTRENFLDWMRSWLKDSEEIDTSDLRGLIATVVYLASLVFRPRFWFLLRR